MDASKITADDIEVHFVLECTECGNPITARAAKNIAEAVEDFNDDGWKIVDGFPTCPDCQSDDV